MGCNAMQCNAMHGCRQTSKEGRGRKTSRAQEKGKVTAEMGGLHEEGYEKIGGG